MTLTIDVLFNVGTDRTQLLFCEMTNSLRDDCRCFDRGSSNRDLLSLTIAGGSTQRYFPFYLVNRFADYAIFLVFTKAHVAMLSISIVTIVLITRRHLYGNGIVRDAA